ncbi:MAG: 23S ribosomal RNA methyltransferase Erm [Halanaerobiales bacterium]|nr:23S ribosomal RNA methyltransferase Erm [Halanaerobiales bacterium]
MNGNKNQLWYSQNFLHSSNLVIDLINKSKLTAEDHVLEIGPGKGIITEELAKRCRKITAIEYDKTLYQTVKNKFLNRKNIEIIQQDFLKYDLTSINNYKVFANIPFHITSAIVRKLTASSNPPRVAYLIMQREAAWKYAGSPYYHESLSSLLLKPYFDLELIHQFQKTDFIPVPRVNIVMLQLKKKKGLWPERKQSSLYQDFIAYVFRQSNQGLKNKCKNIFSYQQLKSLSRNCGFNLRANPTDLSFDQWYQLFQFFDNTLTEKKQRLVQGAYWQLQNNKKIY